MATTKKSTKAPAVKHIGLVKNDPWLEPYEDAIRGRHDHAVWKLNDLTQNGKMKLFSLKILFPSFNKLIISSNLFISFKSI